jgi:hypothetical protein
VSAERFAPAASEERWSSECRNDMTVAECERNKDQTKSH